MPDFYNLGLGGFFSRGSGLFGSLGSGSFLSGGGGLFSGLLLNDGFERVSAGLVGRGGVRGVVRGRWAVRGGGGGESHSSGNESSKNGKTEHVDK